MNLNYGYLLFCILVTIKALGYNSLDWNEIFVCTFFLLGVDVISTAIAARRALSMQREIIRMNR